MAARKTFMATLKILCVATLLLSSCKKEVYYHLELTVEPTEGGKISLISGDYPVGTSVSMEAIPASEYVFSGWSGAASGLTNPLTLTMDSDKSVKASFVKKTYLLTVIVEGEGSVSEKVIASRSQYDSGTVVELTALPSKGWNFVRWEEDLTGSENPAQITVSSEKTVKAVFTKNSYIYNLTIVGPGVVDEYLVEDTKATLEHGTKLLLKAIPGLENGAFFQGWSGDFIGAEHEIVIDMDQPFNITATFDRKQTPYPLPDLTQPSVCLKRFYSDLFSDHVCTYAGNLCTLDYNLDGYPDIITSFDEGSTLAPIRFYLGNSTGSFVPDPINDKKIIGLNECRKIIYGEYNGDGRPDICIISHGVDADPWTGDYPLILLSQDDGSFHDVRFPNYVGYYHGGTAGDFDNDGDTDLFFMDSFNKSSLVLVNDGKGNFTPNTQLLPNSTERFTAELFDLDEDGFLDLIWSLPGEIIWGNGRTFSENESTQLPDYFGTGNLDLDFLFYDLDADGKKDIVAAYVDPFYTIWGVRILANKGNRHFEDVTNQYIDEGEYYFEHDGTLVWIAMEEIDGRVYLVGRMDGRESQTIKLYELSDGKLKRVQNHNYQTLTSGFPISVAVSSMQPGWKMYDAFVFGFQNGVDLSYLVENEYVLEFYLKNTDPSLMFDVHFDADALHAENDNVVYGASVDMSSLKHDGSWERIRIPLQNIDLWSDSKGSYWNQVFQFVIITTSTGGQEFSVKDIRIRKTLQE